MEYKKYGRCKECKKIYRYDDVPKICLKCGTIISSTRFLTDAQKAWIEENTPIII